MSNSLNISALNQYAARFSTTILNEVYRSQNVVTGAELLKLTPVRQVNLGILNRLFGSWKSNAESFRSIYFDFENEEVKSALETFMNIVSRHISVKREDLAPLLQSSVEEALKLLYTPEVYLDEKIRAGSNDEFTRSNAEQLVKYTQIHRKIGEALLQKLVEGGSDSVSQTKALNWIQEIKGDDDLLDDPTPYADQFAEVFPLNLNELIVKEVKNTPSPKSEESKSFFDAAFGEIEPSTSRSNSSKAESGVAILSEIVAKTQTGEKASLNNSFKVEVPKPADDKSYGTIPIRVENLSSAIPLGQRFMFVNQLFNKNSEHFEKAIYELDNVKSFEEAENLIWHRYASKYAWDVNGEAVTSLLNIVKRKFN